MTFMVTKAFVALVNHFAGGRIYYSLVIPVLHSIDDPVEGHPATRLAMKIVTGGLLDKRAPLAGMTSLSRQFALERDGVAHLDIEPPQEGATMWTRRTLPGLSVRILREKSIAATAVNLD